MADRQLDVFFYGLFMDRQVLEGKGIHPVEVRLATVPGYRLRIGRRAALVPDATAQVHGVLMKLSHSQLDTLYSEPSVESYRPEPVMAVTREGTTVPALCYNLPELPPAHEHNAEYAARLRALATRIGLPGEYILSID